LTSSSDACTLSLHDALPISVAGAYRRRNDCLAELRDAGPGHVDVHAGVADWSLAPTRRAAHFVHLLTDGEARRRCVRGDCPTPQDRKSTRLNSSHVAISYAV